MAQQSFDMSRMSTADKILAGGGLLLFIDTFLPWQSVCIKFLNVGACATASAWGGSAGFVGVLLGLFAIALVASSVLRMMGVDLGGSSAMIGAVLAWGTAGFAVLKWVIVLTKDAGWAAWVGLLLGLVIAYGAMARMREAKSPPSAASGGSGGFTP